MSTTTRAKRITITAIVTGALVLGGGGAAFAYWTAQGIGSGVATTTSSTPFTVTSTSPSGAPLTPGGPSQSVAFTVKNPGTGSQKLSAVAVTVAASDGSAWAAVSGCSAADYTIGAPNIAYGQIASSATVSGTVTITMNNLDRSQDGCKNTDVPLYFSAS
ncbi:MAG: hypothetical protein H7288_13590 [Kineosporiaceae bacterium]|nr:hypothetical protein [Aeromicrobium sp.]